MSGDSSPSTSARPRTVVSRQSAVRVFDPAHIEEQASELRSDTTLKARAAKWTAVQKAGLQEMKASYSFIDWLSVFLPCLSWLKKYKVKEMFGWDIMAGVSIGFMVVPQGMSYALLAGLPPVYGLYSAFVPVFMYAAFGSSPHLAVGPVAVTSLLLGDSLRGMFPELDGEDEGASALSPEEIGAVRTSYNEAAVQITLLVGIIYVAVGVARLGFLANFLSHSVISGFTTGAAIIIGLSQLKYFFGVSIPKSHTALENAVDLAQALGDTQWREAVMCSAWLVLLLALKRASKQYPHLSWLRPLGPISVCVLGVAIVKIFDLDGKGLIRVVGDVPQGLPPISISHWFPLHSVGKQIQTSFVLFLVGFMESISIAKALARRHQYKISVTQEVVALGICNLAGSMFSSYACTGSFSRSAVSADIGAKSSLAGGLTAVLIGMVLLFITPVFELVPYNAMGAIVLSSVFGLFELSEAIFLYKANFLDFLVWMAAFLGTVFLGVEIGLGIAIGLALLFVVYQSAFPHTAVLGQLPESKVFRNVKQYPLAIQQPHLLIVRVDAPIYFANVEWVRGRIEKYTQRLASQHPNTRLHFVILDLSPVAFMDSTGMHAMHEMVTELKAAGVRLVLANPSRKVQAQLLRVNLLDAIGKEWVFVNTSDAAACCLVEAAEIEARTGLEDLGLDDVASDGVTRSSTPDDMMKKSSDTLHVAPGHSPHRE